MRELGAHRTSSVATSKQLYFEVFENPSLLKINMRELGFEPR
jgi:hypothetical protein